MNKQLEEIKKRRIHVEYGNDRLISVADYKFLVEQAEKTEQYKQEWLIAQKRADHFNKTNQQLLEQTNLKSALKEFHYTCYTQTCTMNHMENTDYEKGYMAGIRFGRDMADRYLGGEING